jgi:hypothetical protein
MWNLEMFNSIWHIISHLHWSIDITLRFTCSTNGTRHCALRRVFRGPNTDELFAMRTKHKRFLDMDVFFRFLSNKFMSYWDCKPLSKFKTRFSRWCAIPLFALMSVHSVLWGMSISCQMQITKIIIHNSSQFIQFQRFFLQNNWRQPLSIPRTRPIVE